GYEDWKLQRARSRVQASASTAAAVGRAESATARGPGPIARTKLSYKEQRELDALPARVEALEAEQAQLTERLASADTYTRDPQQVPLLQARHEAIEAELMQALERWELLSAR
ncbi:MAG TPA: ABC transporter ATP-binding protein, partial [Rubrivivax sp.]|nr:ABC transporter ATP-binding protein [Rubrivivax sp.]